MTIGKKLLFSSLGTVLLLCAVGSAAWYVVVMTTDDARVLEEEWTELSYIVQLQDGQGTGKPERIT